MLIFHLQSGIWEFHYPFTCNLYGKCFGISVTHLTSDLEVPGSSPGVSNNFFLHFFSFWPFTLPSSLNIKTRTIANNVINNHIYFIITLLSLDPLLFVCNPYGRWLFLKSGFYILVFCEQHRRYFGLIFADFLVCWSWDYILSKCSPIFFSLMSSWSVDDNHQHHHDHQHHHHRHHHYYQDHHHHDHHDHHDDHHCLHVYITSPFLNIVNIIIYHKTWRQTT